MDERPEQRPEGKLLGQALKLARLSQREAARRAGMSEGHLRAILSGYRNVGAGVYAAVKGPPETIARIATSLGVTPAQLEEAGRADAAQALRDQESSIAAGRNAIGGHMAGVTLSPLGRAIERARIQVGMSLETAIERAVVTSDEWKFLMGLADPREERHTYGLARMAIAVGLTYEDVETLNLAVSDEMLHVQANDADRRTSENLAATTAMLDRVRRKLELLPNDQLSIVEQIIDQWTKRNGGAA